MFGKKKVGAGDLPARIISMRQQGVPDPEIFNQLQAEGIKPQDVDMAMGAANEQTMAGAPPSMDTGPVPPGMEAGLYPGGMPPPPTRQGEQATEIETESEDVEVLVEKLVSDKTRRIEGRQKDMEADIGNIRADIHELKQMTVELKEKYVGLQEESLGKVEEYAKELENVGAQIKAMQRILKDIIPTLSDNIIQLQKLVDEIKGKQGSGTRAKK